MAQTSTSLSTARRFIGPRQYAPKGYRDAAGHLPMTDAFGEDCYALAKVAHQSKNYGDAIDLYDRALAVRREKLGPIHEQCAVVLYNIGRAFIDLREYGAAENALTEAAAIYEQVEGPQSVKYAESLGLLALTYTHLKFLPEAEKAFKDSIRIFRGQCFNYTSNCWLPDPPAQPPEEPQLDPLASAAHALADCASLFLLQQRERQAIAFMEEALEIRRFLYSRHQKYRPMIAQTLNKLCELKKSINDGAGAELCIRECLDICLETYGREHPATAQAMSSKAGLAAASNQVREARRLYEDACNIYATVLGEENPLYGLELLKLGRAQELCDEFVHCEKTYVKALDIIKKGLGPNDLKVAEADTMIGTFMMRRLEMERAIEFFRDAVRIRKAVDKSDPILASIYHKLGEAYGQMRETHAEAYFLLAVEAFKENAKTERMHKMYMTDVLDDLGLFYTDFKHYDKAEKCFKESLDARIEVLGDQHAVVAYSYSNFSLLYLHQQRYEDCEKMAKASLDLYNSLPKANVLAKADVHMTLGHCLFQQKRYDEAMASYEKTLDTRRLQGEATEPAVAESLIAIANVHVATKRFGKASIYIKDARRIVFVLNERATQVLRAEIQKTEAAIPPMEEWTNEERAYVQGKLLGDVRQRRSQHGGGGGGGGKPSSSALPTEATANSAS